MLHKSGLFRQPPTWSSGQFLCPTPLWLVSNGGHQLQLFVSGLDNAPAFTSACVGLSYTGLRRLRDRRMRGGL